jgi:hypothetical protein
MKITRRQLRKLIKEFDTRDYNPGDIKPDIDIKGMLNPEKIKVINRVEASGETIVRMLPNPDIEMPMGVIHVYMDNDMYPVSSLKSYWSNFMSQGKGPSDGGFFIVPEGPEDFIKEALTMYCGDYDRVVIRSVSSGAGENFSGILPAKTVEGNPENGIFYKLVVNISDSVIEEISEPCT